MAKPTGDILTGMGEFVFETLALPSDIMLNLEPIDFSIEGTANSVKSYKFKNGRRVQAGGGINQVDHTLTMSIEAMHWQVLELAYGYRSTTEATVAWPTRKEGVLDATGSIVDTDITSTNVMVCVQSVAGVWTSVPSGAGGYTVTVGTNTLSLGATFANRPVVYRVLKSYTNVKALGLNASAIEFGGFKFNGVGYMGSTKVGIQIDRMSLADEVTINPSDVTKLDFKFDLLPTGVAPKGYQLIELPY
jgi:hypothetical protein